MDAFYASVEQRDNPELRGKALGSVIRKSVVWLPRPVMRHVNTVSVPPCRHKKPSAYVLT